MTRPELGPNQKAWIAALRSGEYAQARSALCERTDAGLAFCCLGVALAIMNGRPQEPWDARSVELLDPDEAEYFGVGDTYRYGPWHGDGLASMNDEGASFAEIADILEANPEQYFTEPR